MRINPVRISIVVLPVTALWEVMAAVVVAEVVADVAVAVVVAVVGDNRRET